MSNIRTLKKRINEELSGVIEEAFLWQLAKNKKQEDLEAVIDQVIEVFDRLIEKVQNGRFADNKKAHFKEIRTELNGEVEKLLKQLQ